MRANAATHGSRRMYDYYGCRCDACRAKNADKTRAHNHRQLGVSREQYAEMLKRQAGVCAICKRKPKAGRSLVLDHNHSTGQVRGLLCDLCNRGIGFLGEESGLKRALDYLQRWTSF